MFWPFTVRINCVSGLKIFHKSELHKYNIKFYTLKFFLELLILRICMETLKICHTFSARCFNELISMCAFFQSWKSMGARVKRIGEKSERGIPQRGEILSAVSMVFCFKNCSDLLWEKIVLVLKIGDWRPRLRKMF